MTYIVLQRGRQRAGGREAGVGGGHKTGEISKGRGTIQRKTPPGEAPTPPPPRPGGRCGEERGAAPAPAAGAAVHRPVPAGEAAWLPPSPWHTHTRVCARVCAAACTAVPACAPLGKHQPWLWQRGAVSRAGGGRDGDTGVVVGGCFEAFLGTRLTAGVFPPPWSSPAEEAEGGDGERPGAGRGWGQTDGAPGAPGSAPPGGGHRGSREPAAGSGAEGPGEPG